MRGQKNMSINIAIDGPSGAGKSTIAKMLARKMEYVYVDTGALYRSIALYMIRNGVDMQNSAEVSEKLSGVDIRLAYENGSQQVILCGENVSELIRTPEISMGASKVSAIPEVRSFLLDLQKDIAQKNNIIMDGRDIGTVVLPNADVKIFLTASAEKRAERRYKELHEKGDPSTYEEVLADINRRDYNDTHRETAPLKKAEGAVEIDTSELTLEQSAQTIAEAIEKRLKLKSADKKQEPSARREMLDFSGIRPVTDPKKYSRVKLFFYTILRAIVTLVYKIKFKFVIVGKENIVQTGSVVIASNHRTDRDPIWGSLAVKTPCSYMAKEELFKGPKPFVALIKFMGAFPVERGSGDTGVIGTSIEKLQIGRNLMIFPEGTRSKDGKLGKGKTGVALIAALAQVPVVPMAICFKGEKPKFRQKIIIAYGKAIRPDELKISSSDLRQLKEVKKKIMGSIAELVDENVNKL